MHGGTNPGAPKGNRNAFKHARYTAEAIANRREVAALIRAMRALVRLTAYPKFPYALLANLDGLAILFCDGMGVLYECDPARSVLGLIRHAIETDDFVAANAAGDANQEDRRSRKPGRSRSSVAAMRITSSPSTASFSSGGRPCLRRMPCITSGIWRSARSSGWPGAIHPAVRAAIKPGVRYTAREAFEAIYSMKQLQRQARALLADCAALVVPTVPTISTIDAMLDEPLARNTMMGTYTYFVNPLDFCAVAVPGHRLDNGLVSSLCFVGRDGEDGRIRTLATAFEAALQSAALLSYGTQQLSGAKLPDRIWVS
jgi:hypothetical protein